MSKLPGVQLSSSHTRAYQKYFSCGLVLVTFAVLLLAPRSEAVPIIGIAPLIIFVTVSVALYLSTLVHMSNLDDTFYFKGVWRSGQFDAKDIKKIHAMHSSPPIVVLSVLDSHSQNYKVRFVPKGSSRRRDIEPLVKEIRAKVDDNACA